MKSMRLMQTRAKRLAHTAHQAIVESVTAETQLNATHSNGDRLVSTEGDTTARSTNDVHDDTRCTPSDEQQLILVKRSVLTRCSEFMYTL